MKKFIKMCGCFLAFFMIVSGLGGISNKARAVSQVSLSEFSNEVNTILSDFVKFDERTGGSDSEKQASEYIKNYLDSNNKVSAKTNAYIKDGVQQFTFESPITGNYETSQNIIYEYKSLTKNAKKVIIGCNYDTYSLELNENYEYEIVKTEGLNVSAGSVATLLSLTKYLDYGALNFDIEFVFFGAGELNRAGSTIYTNGISDEEKENILCMINLDSIALGENLYFYSHEVETKASKFVEKVAKTNEISVSKINTVHLNKNSLAEKNELGLYYTHIALESDNINFMKRGITTINIFAGDYNKGLIVGRCEFLGKDVVSYTSNDNVAYITENYGFDNVNKNLYEVYKMINKTLTDFDFIDTFENSFSVSWFFKLFANEKLVVYLTLVAFLIFIVVAMYWHYKLSIKAYNANIEMGFLSSVVKISEEIDKTGADEEVAKVVSQVVANDIKKDKVIKVKRKKDDK